MYTSVNFYEMFEGATVLMGKNTIETQNCRFLENLGVCNYQNSKIVRKNILPVILHSILSELSNCAYKKIPRRCRLRWYRNF